jgi:hypothetical protein
VPHPQVAAQGLAAKPTFETNNMVLLQSSRPSSPAATERLSDAEQDDFGDDDGLNEQEGAVGAEDSQRAFGLAPPVKRQSAGNNFDELKIFVRRRREEGCIPPPGRDDNNESADERHDLECAAAGRSPNEHYVSVHD